MRFSYCRRTFWRISRKSLFENHAKWEMGPLRRLFFLRKVDRPKDLIAKLRAHRWDRRLMWWSQWPMTALLENWVAFHLAGDQAVRFDNNISLG